MHYRHVTHRSTFSTKSAEVDVTRGPHKTVIRFLCIEDLDEGMSVTNDIERVIADLVSEGDITPGMHVVYQDTQGVWDEVLISETCTFAGFRSLNAATRDEAILIVLARLKDNKWK
jgi:hypothetical protein